MEVFLALTCMWIVQVIGGQQEFWFVSSTHISKVWKNVLRENIGIRPWYTWHKSKTMSECIDGTHSHSWLFVMQEVKLRKQRRRNYTKFAYIMINIIFCTIIKKYGSQLWYQLFTTLKNQYFKDFKVKCNLLMMLQYTYLPLTTWTFYYLLCMAGFDPILFHLEHTLTPSQVAPARPALKT